MTEKRILSEAPTLDEIAAVLRQLAGEVEAHVAVGDELPAFVGEHADLVVTSLKQGAAHARLAEYHRMREGG